MKRCIAHFIIIALATVLVGCGGSQQKKPWKTLTEYEQANTKLSLQNQELQTQNDQLTEQVATLSKLGHDNRLTAIDTLEKIRIGKRTGFYDKDSDGTKETLVVYLEPTDTAQDYVKAVGQAVIELWDLDDPNDSFITVWELRPEMLHTSWGGTIFAGYYRISGLPLEITPEPQKEYTLKVIFTDYLSGKVLTDQMVIHP